MVAKPLPIARSYVGHRDNLQKLANPVNRVQLTTAIALADQPRIKVEVVLATNRRYMELSDVFWLENDAAIGADKLPKRCDEGIGNSIRIGIVVNQEELFWSAGLQLNLLHGVG